MGFTEFRGVVESLETAAHATVLSSGAESDRELFTILVDVSVNDELADKAHHYIGQNIRSDAFPYDTVAIVESAIYNQTYRVFIGPDDALPQGVDFDYVRDPVDSL